MNEDEANAAIDDAKDNLNEIRISQVAALLRETGRYGSDAAEVVADVLAATFVVNAR